MLKSLIEAIASYLAAHRRPLSITLLLFTLPHIVAVAQTSRPTDGSTPLGLTAGSPSGSYSLGGFDNVNLYNGSLNFRLPLVSVGGRGAAAHTITLPIKRDWMVERVEDEQGNIYRYPVDGREESLAPGYGPGVMHIRYAGMGRGLCPGDPNIEEQEYRYVMASTRLSFTGPDGTEIELRDVPTGGAAQNTGSTCPSLGFNRGKVFVSVDGSGITFISNSDIRDPVRFDWPASDHAVSGLLKFPDGTVYNVANGLVTFIRDRNGNKVSFEYVSNRLTAVTDSLKRRVTVAYNVAEGGVYGTCDRITYEGFGGADRVVRVSKTSLGNALRAGYGLLTWSHLFPGLQGSVFTSYNPTVVSAVWLPDGVRRYQLQYNSHGELARAVLPTGGAFEYDYAPGTTNGYGHGVVFLSAEPQIHRRLVERRVYADGSALSSRMTYSRPETEDSSCCSVTTLGYVEAATRDAAGALLQKTRHYFHGPGAAPSLDKLATDLTPWQDGKEYRTDTFDDDGTTVLRRTTHTWAAGGGAYINPRVTATVTTEEPDGAERVSKQTFSYDQYNNQTDVYDYDHGAGAPGPLIRRTHTDYLTTNPVNNTDYTSHAVHLRSLPTRTSVYDAAGAEKARTTFEYDNYATDANHAPLVARPNISGLDAAYTTGYVTRGNVTRVSRFLLPAGTSLSSYDQYDAAGSAVKSINARGHATTFDFADRYGAPNGEARANTPPAGLAGQLSYAMATKVTNALGHTSYAQFDYHTGRPVDAEDVSGMISTGHYDDVLDRPTQVITGAGTASQRQSSFTYNDAARTAATTSDFAAYGDDLLKGEVVYDGLGRISESRQYETAANYIATRRNYDALGRAYRVSNPFRPWQGETPAWTTTQFDALGRTTAATTPDAAQVKTAYSGYVVTATDQAGKQRRSESNALGWLKTVNEAPNDPGFNYQTSYAHDALGNLRTVTQGAQTRTFAYDSLGRLTSAVNPESGTTSYQYDAADNLTQKTDARGVTTVITYDALDRPVSKTYQNDPAATPAVSYDYDAQALPAGAPAFDRGRSTGRLVAVTYGGGSAGTYRGYDPLGRVVRQIQQTDGVNYLAEAAYNRAGIVTSETYPAVPGAADRRTVTYSYDGAGRLSSLSGPATTYAAAVSASAVGYAAHGGLKTQTLGNGLVHSVLYNNRLQPTQIRLGTAASPSSVLGLTYGYGTTANNGNVLSVSYAGGGLSHTQSFTYDALNRLATSQETAGGATAWAQTNGYDRYGNRWLSLGGGAQSLSFGAATNRVVGWGYDAAGNLTSDASANYSHDAENRLRAVNGAPGYVYDGEGRRVKKTLGEATRFVYGVSGQLLAEYDASTGALEKESFYGPGGLLATAVPNGQAGAGTRYVTTDRLASPRVITGAGGAVVSRHDYKPFGEEIFAGTGGRTTAMGFGAGGGVRRKFTSYERDGETGLDFARARYYASGQGRFTSPDPFGGSMVATDPQSLNRYAYVGNNPLTFADPSGLARQAAMRMERALTAGAEGGRVEPDYTAEGYADYLARLEQTYAAITQADAINEMLAEGTIDSETAAEMASNNPLLRVVLSPPPQRVGPVVEFKRETFDKCLYDMFKVKVAPSDGRTRTFSSTRSGGEITVYSEASYRFETIKTDMTSKTKAGLGNALGLTDSSDPNHNYVASDYAGSKGVSDVAVMAAHIHEIGNSLNVLYPPARPVQARSNFLRGQDSDAGMALEECVFGGYVLPRGRRVF